MAALTFILAAFFGGQELWLILVIVLVLFGGAKLPSLARGLGQSIKEFKKAQKEVEEPETTKSVEAKSAEAKAAEVKKIEPANTHGSN